MVVEPTEPGARQKLRLGDRLAQEAELLRSESQRRLPSHNIPCAARVATDLWLPIATPCNPLLARKKCLLIRECRRGKNFLYSQALTRFFGTGAIERKRPGFPAKPVRGHHLFITASCLLSPARELPHSNDGVHQNEFRPNQRTLLDESKSAPPKQSIRGSE